jgi:predicted ATPase
MRLSSIALRDFKAFRSVDLPTAPLTVLIGKNNAGKSSVLHALALVAQSVGSNRLITQGRLVDLGPRPADLINGEGSLATIRTVWSGVVGAAGFSFEFRVPRDGSQAWASDPSGSPWGNIAQYRYVSASRHVDASVYPLGESASDNPRTAPELFDTLAYDDELLRRLSDRTETLFRYGLKLDLLENRRVTLMALGSGGRHNIVNVGAGMIQTIWVLTQLELVRREGAEEDLPSNLRLIGLEEPELHLHPAMQTDMARLLVEFVHEGVGIICTTQSEHLLLSLLTLVLEGSLAPSDLAVYYIEAGVAEPLAVDEKGRISGGLRGFFEANENQLRRHIDLLKQRG